MTAAREEPLMPPDIAGIPVRADADALLALGRHLRDHPVRLPFHGLCVPDEDDLPDGVNGPVRVLFRRADPALLVDVAPDDGTALSGHLPAALAAGVAAWADSLGAREVTVEDAFNATKLASASGLAGGTAVMVSAYILGLPADATTPDALREWARSWDDQAPTEGAAK